MNKKIKKPKEKSPFEKAMEKIVNTPKEAVEKAINKDKKKGK